MRKHFLSSLGYIIVLLALYSLYKTLPLLMISDFSGNDSQQIKKLQEVLSIAGDYYVDKIDWKKTITAGIDGLLSSLDPHTVYIPKKDAEHNDENFDGKYQGIGIQYDVIDGDINVISVISGSPADKVGLMAGDIIKKVDGKNIHGIKVGDVPSKLKGPKGSKVHVSVLRSGVKGLVEIDIIRGEVPIFTVNTFFMLDDSTGYVWLNRFASTTADELENALISMEKKGMKQLILDLRNNGGGYLRQAVQVVGKFVSGHKKVVYTKGRLSEFDNTYYTDEFGQSIDRDYPLIILINHSSASASEIVSGALQDYDRALIVGTRSFGKGLVQNEFTLDDSSRLRITVSKYYTPSGRLIQRPYKNKSIDSYYNDAYEPDSARADSQEHGDVFYTTSGRKVYGGGGIRPDVEQAFTSVADNKKLIQRLFAKRIFFEDANRIAHNQAALYKNIQSFLKNFTDRKKYVRTLMAMARLKGISLPSKLSVKDKMYIFNRLRAEIARNLWGQKAYWQAILQYDNQLKVAQSSFEQARQLENSIQTGVAKN